MRVTCPECLAVYKIPDEKITQDVCRARCKKCGAKIIIRREPAQTEQAGSPGSSFGDDEFVEHEDKTVVDTVPELRNFDATPAIGSGFLSGTGAPGVTTTPYSEPVPGLKMRKFDEASDESEEPEVSITPVDGIAARSGEGGDTEQTGPGSEEPVAPEPEPATAGAPQADASPGIPTEATPPPPPQAAVESEEAATAGDTEGAPATEPEALVPPPPAPGESGSEKEVSSSTTEGPEEVEAASPAGAAEAMPSRETSASRLPRPRRSLPPGLLPRPRGPVSESMSNALRRTVSAIVFVAFVMFLLHTL